MFISVGRYRGIRRPLQQRSESEYSVLYRVVLTWGIGMLLASPIPVLAIIDMENIMPTPHVCEMNNEHFLIFGSLLSFYIPMVIMVTTYALTIHHLKKQKLCALAGSRHILSKGGMGRGSGSYSIGKGGIGGSETYASVKEKIGGGSGCFSAGSSRATITTSYTGFRNGHHSLYACSIAGTETSHR